METDPRDQPSTQACPHCRGGGFIEEYVGDGAYNASTCDGCGGSGRALAQRSFPGSDADAQQREWERQQELARPADEGEQR